MSKFYPIVGQPMQFENILTNPAPEFLNGIQPSGISWQSNELQPRVGTQSLQDVGMLMNRPVILDHIHGFKTAIALVQLPIELDQFRAANNVSVQIRDFPGQR